MAEPILHSVKLSSDELLRLDGAASADVQAAIDLVKHARILAARFNIDEQQGIFLASAVQEGQRTGRLGFDHAQVRWCRLCGAGGGYAKHARSGRYHRKGEDDTSKPILLSGVDLARGFVNVIGWPAIGCCSPCWVGLRPLLVELIEPLPIEVHPKITGHAARWKRWDHMRCKCGWEGHEGEMGRLPTLMGDGHYPGKCPQCGAENVFLARMIERRGDGFSMIPVPIPWCELPEGIAILERAAEKGKEHAEARAREVKNIQWENSPRVGWLRDTGLSATAETQERSVLAAFNQAVETRWAELKEETRKSRG